MQRLKQKEWEKIENEFLSGLTKYFIEIHESIQQLRKNSTNPLIRSQVCLAFIGVDTFSRFHQIFQGKREGLNIRNEERFKEWLNKFVFTDENKIYKSYRNRIKSNAEIIWKLRNSFLHFYSFPSHKENESIIMFTFSRPDAEVKEVERNLRSKGHKAMFIDIFYLIEAISNGFMLQLNSLGKMIDEEPRKYIESVLYAHGIIMQESSSTINLDTKEKT